MDEKMIESLVREVLRSVGKTPAEAVKVDTLTVKDYPLGEKRPELIKSRTGKSLDEISLESVMKGRIGFDDLRIHPATIEYQAQIAENSGRPQLAESLRRAKELTAVPDDEVLSLYNSLRPYRSSKADLLGYADRLEKTYNAPACAKFIREAAEVYEKRSMLA